MGEHRSVGGPTGCLDILKVETDTSCEQEGSPGSGVAWPCVTGVSATPNSRFERLTH
jgi:hypothetical protein